jgi:ubiquitin C-terminal hydrolase
LTHAFRIVCSRQLSHCLQLTLILAAHTVHCTLRLLTHTSVGGAKGKAKRVDARKRLLLLRPPQVLMCHLKRLQARGKLNAHVAFTEVLDMAPFCWQDPEAEAPLAALYRLYAVVEHRGGSSGGHYVAYVRAAGPGGWVLTSDDSVRQCTLAETLKAQAYMLWYERIPEAASAAGEE